MKLQIPAGKSGLINNKLITVSHGPSKRASKDAAPISIFECSKFYVIQDSKLTNSFTYWIATCSCWTVIHVLSTYSLDSDQTKASTNCTGKFKSQVWPSHETRPSLSLSNYSYHFRVVGKLIRKQFLGVIQHCNSLTEEERKRVNQDGVQ